MTLYKKVGSRYKPATPGERLAAAIETLQSLGLAEFATQLNAGIIDAYGYKLPQEPEAPPKAP